MPPAKGEEISKRYFSLIDGDTYTWQCQCGVKKIRKPNTGWSNLMIHIRNEHQHSGLREAGQSSLDCFTAPKVTKKGTNIHNWLNWVCSGLKPFSFVEDPLTREYTNLQEISVNSFMKHMEAGIGKIRFDIHCREMY